MGKMIVKKWSEMTTLVKMGIIGIQAEAAELGNDDIRILTRIYEQVKPVVTFTEDFKSFSIDPKNTLEINVLSTQYLSPKG
jgi:hypothetical protein